ncbi:MAG: M56 family metallopeptidase [Planctomycetaceae bacterium]|nr:M56 family metallopeptidase [Planctomycetaceae bacterium]
MSQTFLFTMIQSSLFLAISGLVVLLLFRVFPCHTSRLTRLCWCIVLLQGVLWIRIPLELAVLPSQKTASEIPATQTVLPHVAGPAMHDAMDSTALQPIGDIPLATSQEALPHTTSFSWSTLVLSVWGSGVSVLAGLQLFGYFRMLADLKQAEHPTAAQQNEWETLLAKFSISPKSVRLLVTERIGPGLIRQFSSHAVVIPRTFWEEASPEVRQRILKHEILHYLHHDLLKSFFLRLITWLHWFNPIAWLAAARFDDAAEWRCDAETFGQSKQGPVELAETLLLFRETTPVIAVYRRTFCGTNLITRLQQLSNYTQGRKDTFMKKSFLITLCAMFLVFGLLRIELKAKPGNEPEDKPAASQAETKQAVTPAKSPRDDISPKMVQVHGKAILPDGTPAKGFQLFWFGASPTDKNAGGDGNNVVRDDGTFSWQIFADCDCMMSILDPGHQWAAPYLTFSVGQSDLDEELVFQFEPGVLVSGTVKDEITGKPLPDLQVDLRIDSTEGDASTMFSTTTDSEGRYKFFVFPKGDFYLSIGNNVENFTRKGKTAYSKKVVFDEKKPVTLDFSIPSPFIGKVLHSDGTPAKDAFLKIIPMKTMGLKPRNGFFYYGDTDQEGLFFVPRMPDFVSVRISDLRKNESFLGWVNTKENQGKEMLFRLEKSCTVKGRLIDSTGKPLAKQVIFASYEDAEGRKNNPDFGTFVAFADEEGNFTMQSLAAKHKYEFFITPGQTEWYGGNGTEPHVLLKTLTPETPGEEIDLGEIKVQ